MGVWLCEFESPGKQKNAKVIQSLWIHLLGEKLLQMLNVHNLLICKSYTDDVVMTLNETSIRIM